MIILKNINHLNTNLMCSFLQRLQRKKNWYRMKCSLRVIANSSLRGIKEDINNHLVVLIVTQIYSLWNNSICLWLTLNLGEYLEWRSLFEKYSCRAFYSSTSLPLNCAHLLISNKNPVSSLLRGNCNSWLTFNQPHIHTHINQERGFEPGT